MKQCKFCELLFPTKVGDETKFRIMWIGPEYRQFPACLFTKIGRMLVRRAKETA